MGIQVEFNPDLALRNYEAFKKGERKREECIPQKLQTKKIYPFLKKGQRNYWLLGEIPLLQTEGNQILSKPIASIKIMEATHVLIKGELYTKGRYKIIEVFKDDKIYFNGFAKNL